MALFVFFTAIRAWRGLTGRRSSERGSLHLEANSGGRRRCRADKQLSVQTLLPLTLIPIRIELDVPSFTPPPPFPVPHNPLEFGVDPSLPAYRTPEMTASFRLRDVFLWNLHETLITPDSFAMTLVNDLDLPHPVSTAAQISSQIRQQLEEYAGVALHPLFHETIRDGLARDGAWRAGGATQKNGGAPSSSAVATNSDSVVPEATATAESEPINSPDDIYRCIITLNINLLNKLYTDKFEWSLLHRPGAAEQFARLTCADIGLSGEWIPAIAHAIYEAVLRLRKEACESGGLIAALLNSISEGSVGGGGGGANGGVNGTGIEIENMAADAAAAGWRFDNEQLGEEWGPKVELLSKEEIEKREGDRERQIRRVRRETARFSSNAGMASFFKILGAGPVTSNNPSAGGGGDSGGGGNSRVGTPVPLGGGAGAGAGAGASEMDVDTNDSNNGNNNYNNQPGTPGPPAAAAPGQVPATTGRPERGKKKRRFRSLSPVGRSGSISGGGGGAGGFLGVSGGRGTPDLAMFGAVGSTGGYGGGLGGLSEWYVCSRPSSFQSLHYPPSLHLC